MRSCVIFLVNEPSRPKNVWKMIIVELFGHFDLSQVPIDELVDCFRESRLSPLLFWRVVVVDVAHTGASVRVIEDVHHHYHHERKKGESISRERGREEYPHRVSLPPPPPLGFC